MNRRKLLQSLVAGGGVAALGSRVGADGRVLAAQTARPAAPTPASARTRYRGPIVDVHMHAYPAADAIDPGLGNPVTGKPPGVKDGEAHRIACMAEMARLNIVKGVVSGGTGDRLAAAIHWRDGAPDKLIAGAGVRGSEDTPLPPVPVLRDAFTSGKLRVLGEVTAQYAGRSLSDPIYDPYLALCEELDIPVALHTGMGPPGTSFDPCCRGFRASLGNPSLIEEALNRHPKLRVNLMHAAWPYLADTVALMTIYPQVHVDLGALGWGLPRDEFHSYLGALRRAGFVKRVMFGSDHMYWPDLIGVAVEGVDAAPFLTAADKQAIFHDNAVRFYKLG